MSRPIDTLCLQSLAKGDPIYLSRMQGLLREQEANGDIQILFMDDEIARVQFLNPAWARVLSGANGGAA
jgi:hypothetical protein